MNSAEATYWVVLVNTPHAFPCYWCANDFSMAPEDAIRFARKEDAQRMARYYLCCGTEEEADFSYVEYTLDGVEVAPSVPEKPHTAVWMLTTGDGDDESEVNVEGLYISEELAMKARRRLGWEPGKHHDSDVTKWYLDTE